MLLNIRWGVYVVNFEYERYVIELLNTHSYRHHPRLNNKCKSHQLNLITVISVTVGIEMMMKWYELNFSAFQNLPLKSFVHQNESLQRWDIPRSTHQHVLVLLAGRDFPRLSLLDNLVYILGHLIRTTIHCPCRNSKYHFPDDKQINKSAKDENWQRPKNI